MPGPQQQFPQQQFPQQQFPQQPTTQVPAATTASPQTQSCIQSCPRTNEYNPICGTNQVSYDNVGHLNCAQMCGVSKYISFMQLLSLWTNQFQTIGTLSLSVSTSLELRSRALSSFFI